MYLPRDRLFPRMLKRKHCVFPLMLKGWWPNHKSYPGQTSKKGGSYGQGVSDLGVL